MMSSRALADPASPPPSTKSLPSDVPANHPAAPAVEGMIKKDILKTEADGKFHGAKPVTRYELAVVLSRFVDYIEQAKKPIKQTQFPVPKSAITAPAGTPAYDAQVRLIRDGFVPVSSPLLKAPVTGVVTAQDLGSIMAEVTSRISDRALPVTPNAGPVD